MALFVASSRLCAAEPSAEGEVIPLLNGKDLNWFYSYFKEYGVFKDPAKVFTLQDGVLRVSGEKIGGLTTKSNFADYRLVAEYKWGEQTWEPRKRKTRNSGILVHCSDADRIWMRSLEVQIQEGATGDVVLKSGSVLTVGGVSKYKSEEAFERPDKQPWRDELGFRGVKEMENPHGEWNTLEILCHGDRLQVKLNGTVTVEGTGAIPSSGQIVLQSNGAEIFFRKLDLYPLKKAAPKQAEKKGGE